MRHGIGSRFRSRREWVLFQFPTIGGLDLLTKRDVIPCNNGQFFITKWKEGSEGKAHRFPTRANVLAFNLPPYLRSEQDLARMVAPFAHLLEATQVLEKGGPMKLILGSRKRGDIPKEMPIIFGGNEFRIAMAIRSIEGEERCQEDQRSFTKEAISVNRTFGQRRNESKKTSIVHREAFDGGGERFEGGEKRPGGGDRPSEKETQVHKSDKGLHKKSNSDADRSDKRGKFIGEEGGDARSLQEGGDREKRLEGGDAFSRCATAMNVEAGDGCILVTSGGDATGRDERISRMGKAYEDGEKGGKLC